MRARTSRPENIDDIRFGPYSTPEDDTTELLNRLRESADEPARAVEVSQASLAVVNQMPDVIERVMASPDRYELVEVARMLDAANKSNLQIVFYTPIGDIRCRISWASCRPDQLAELDGMFFVKLRAADVSFTPKAGADFELGFHGRPERFRMVCLATPQRIYPGVDLMCFLPHTSPVEKNGKLKEGAPSVVSGAVSDDVDPNGEPIVAGEKSASVEDFDRVRETSSI